MLLHPPEPQTVARLDAPLAFLSPSRDSLGHPGGWVLLLHPFHRGKNRGLEWDGWKCWGQWHTRLRLSIRAGFQVEGH